MNKIKFLYFIIGILVISNFVLAWLFFENKSRQFHPDKPRNLVIERLHFDKKQIEQYDALIQIHRINSRDLGEQIQESKKELYTQLNQEQNDSTIHSLISKITAKQKELELIHYHHFLEIKSICTPDQMPLFEALTKDLIEIFPMGHKHQRRR